MYGAEYGAEFDGGKPPADGRMPPPDGDMQGQRDGKQGVPMIYAIVPVLNLAIGYMNLDKWNGTAGEANWKNAYNFELANGAFQGVAWALGSFGGPGM